MSQRIIISLALLLAAIPCVAQPSHPFGGEVLDLVGEAETIRSGATLEARTLAAEKFLETLYKDPYLKELGPRMGLDRWLKDMANGRPFDAARFKAAAADAVANHSNTTADVGKAELLQKLEVIELAFTAPRRAGRATGRPVDAESVGANPTTEIVGRRHTRVMNMESVPGARVLRVSESVELPAGSSREAVALDLYGRFVTPEGRDARGELRAGLAHREVGRAVLGPAVPHPNGAETADVLKGIGPTPFANNRFNSKATGTFPLPEAVRDWNATELLRKAGVAVYEPVAIVALPHMEWSKSEGWRPVAVYVRRPRENLRFSDLENMSKAQKRALLESLKSKISSELESVGRTGPISDKDVIRHFVERLGRTAGIFQGGIARTGGAPYYFHGMLHDQNVSLMGEIVDVGNSEGVTKTRAEMERLWKASNYERWLRTDRDYRGLRGNVETLLFNRMVGYYNKNLGAVADGGLSEAEVKEIFTRAYREGRRGMSASDPRMALTTRAEPTARTERTAERSAPDRFARYRRADGTLAWGKMTREGALREGSGLGHFALALFLKEIAVVTATGDRARIEEFFEGLMTTDFYKHYGLFVAGARVGEIGYTRFLQRYVKPKFVNGLLKTNLVLAAGIALPLIVEGRFEGKAFAISVASLGLSSAAVKAGVRGISWVMNLKKAKDTGVLARFGMKAGRLAKFGGWFYTAAELAVILFVAEKIEGKVNEVLDLAKARSELADAGKAFLAEARGDATEASLSAAAEAYHQAWIDYRNFLYRPLHQDEAIFAERLEKSARKAKLLADERKAALARVKDHDSLRASLERRHGSLEAYAESLVARDEAKLEEDVNTYLASYNMNRDKHLREVYESNRRGESLLGDVDDLDWLLSGAEAGTGGDPYGERNDVFASWGRSRSRASLDDALGDASSNRMQAYDDEAEILGAVANVLRTDGHADLASVLDERRGTVLGLKAADRRLIDGDGIIDTSTGSGGLAERVLRSAAERN